MLHVRAELSFMVLFDQCSFLVFHLAAVFTLMHSCSGQSQVIGPLQPAVALIGDDIILPCKLDPVMDALDMTVEWSRPDLDPRFVLVWRDGVELESKKNPSYTNRTSLFTDELKNGNISLKISKVKLSDEGKYKCFVPELEKHTAVQLIVGSASSISAWINSTISSSRVVLQCKSAGWYPEPELLWLDGEGNLLSAGPTETLRGPDDLYTVSSRVTVEKRHSNNITCRVQQRNTNQSRETHIHVPDDFFMVISPSSPPSKPASHPNIIIGVVIVALVVLILILTVVFVVWKKRRAKCKNKKSEEDGAGQAGKEKTKNSKNDTSGSQVVEGEREPLMTGREEENDVDSREEQRHEDERETKQDQFLLETEQVRNINSPREKRINLSAVNEKESLITVEEKTQDMAGREEERKETKQNDHKKQTKKETKQRRNINSSGTKTSAMTETEPQFEMKQEAHEEQSRRGRHETHNVDIRGEQRYKDDIKMSRTGEDRINQFIKTENVSQSTTEQETHEEEMTGMKAERAEGGREKKMEAGKNYLGLQFLQQPIVFGKESKSFNFSFHLSSDQEPWREKETQQEQLGEKRQMERNVDMKKSDTEKQRAEENGDEGNNLDSVFVAQKETQREKLEVEKQREENQRRLQSETRREREKDETELKTRKDNKNQHHTEEKTVRTNRRIKKVERENQRDKKGMTERKRDEQRGQTESRISSVSSKVPLSTDLKIQDKTQGQNHEKQPENTSQQSREQIREQPEKLRGAERKEGAQGKELEVNEGLKSEETNRKYKRREKLQLSHEGELQVEQQVNINQKEQLEKSVSLTGRGVDCVEKKQEEEPMEEASDADQNNIQSRKHTEEIKLQEVCTLQDKKEQIQAGHHQNFKKVQKYVNKQNDQFMEVDDFAHNQSAATAQLNETIQRANHQQRLPVQTEPQEFLKENNEDLEDLMEVEEHSHPKEPKEEPMLLLEEKSSNFPLPLYTDQKPWRKKETQGQLVEKTQRMESEVLEVNQGLKSEETMRKAKETGVDCLQGKQEEELMETDQTCDADQKDDNYRKRSAEPELQDFCTLLIKKQKVQEERRARKRQNYKKLKK